MKFSVTVFALCLLIGGCLYGCAQSTDTIADQPIAQQPQLDSRQAQQGVNSQNYVYVYNAPQGKKLPGSNDGPTVVLHGWQGNNPEYPSTQPAVLDALDATSDGAELASASASGQLQAGITININTTGSGSNAQQPSQGSLSASPNSQQTASPNQEPTANVTAPIAVGLPGSAPQASAQGQVVTGGTGGSQNLSPQQQADLKTLIANVKAGVPGAIEALTRFLETPSPQPPQ